VQYIDYHPFYQDTTFNAEDHPINRFWSHINRGLKAFSIDHTLSEKGRMLQIVKDAGFHDAKEVWCKLPIGTWPRDKRLKEVGAFMRKILHDSAENIAREPLATGLWWRDVDIQFEVAAFRNALKTCTGQPYFTFRSVYGQKPE